MASLLSRAQFYHNFSNDGTWLHLITQSPSLIPTGFLSSCNNLLVGRVKNAKDRDLVVAALHRSEKGFTSESLNSKPISAPNHRFS